MILLLRLLVACCGNEPPVWSEVEPVHLGNGPVTIDLAASLDDDRGTPTFEVGDDPDVIAELDGARLTLTPQPGWTGETTLVVTAVDACDNRADLALAVDAALPGTTTGTPAACPVPLAYATPNAPDRVVVAGTMNDWSTETLVLDASAGGWSTTLQLAPGVYAYKFVEISEQAFDDVEVWVCDPSAAQVVCDPGAAPPGQPFTQDCTPGAASCNSLLVVPNCALPTVTLETIDVDRAAGKADATFAVVPGVSLAATALEVTLDGAPVAVSGASVSVDGLSEGHHVLRAVATDDAGHASEPVVVPFWTDAFDWDRAVVYFAFVDRMLSGSAGNDDPTGATGADYDGGDWAGLSAMLPYLDDLGVTVLWISNPQDNAEGAWDGDCGLTYAGYHGYWPADPFATEAHLGSEDDLADLVDAAHARGMRVIMDWVGNHVHEDHPYFVDHPEWFHPPEDCKATVNGQMGFDRIPEECWFAPYLPDVDYSNPAALHAMVDDAMVWTETYGFDGLRVDAVKHMSHGTVRDLEAEIDRRIEHAGTGLDEEFWTVGETFADAGPIAAYLGPDGLDGQFDFPLYYAVRNTFGHGQGEVMALPEAWNASKAAFGEARMSTFLGNHDVNRFVTDAYEGYHELCEGGGIAVASAPAEAWPYESLRLGFTFLFTMPGVPLVYYGDELGLPGYADPDNRQALSTHVSDLGGVTSVDDLATRAGAEPSRTARHVRALAKARAAHPALSKGGWTEWWREFDVGAYARQADGDFALVVLNRSGADRTLDNGLSFAGLPQGTYEDVLTGDTFTSVGDRISVPVPARGSRVLVHR